MSIPATPKIIGFWPGAANKELVRTASVETRFNGLDLADMTEDYRAGNSSVQLEKITLDIDIEFLKGTTFGNATSEKHKRCFVGAIVVLDTAPTANWTDLSARQYFNTLYFDSYNFTTRPIRDYWQTKSGGRFHVLAEKQEMIGAPELGYPQVLHWSFDRRLHNTEIE